MKKNSARILTDIVDFVDQLIVGLKIINKQSNNQAGRDDFNYYVNLVDDFDCDLINEINRP
jgi:hypothetical protein